MSRTEQQIFDKGKLSLKKTCAVVLTVALSQAVSAMPITGIDTVTVGTQEWAQLDLFTNVSWNEINAQCEGGVCGPTSQINGWDLDGWTWASDDAVVALYEEFAGRPAGSFGRLVEVDSTWAPAFMTAFRPTIREATVSRVIGNTAASFSAGDNSRGLTGIVVDDTAIGGQDVTGFFLTNFDFMAPDLGGWFYRETMNVDTVPVPATLTLFGLGLAVLGWSRRKKA